MLKQADRREEEAQERNGRDDRGREQCWPKADQIADDARSERGGRRDGEPDESRGGIHPAEQMLRGQRLDEADGAHDPQRHCETEERLRGCDAARSVCMEVRGSSR